MGGQSASQVPASGQRSNMAVGGRPLQENSPAGFEQENFGAQAPGWAQELGYAAHGDYSSDEGGITFVSEFIPVRILSEFSISLESDVERRLANEARLLLLEFDQFMVVSARIL